MIPNTFPNTWSDHAVCEEVNARLLVTSSRDRGKPCSSQRSHLPCAFDELLRTHGIYFSDKYRFIAWLTVKVHGGGHNICSSKVQCNMCPCDRRTICLQSPIFAHPFFEGLDLCDQPICLPRKAGYMYSPFFLPELLRFSLPEWQCLRFVVKFSLTLQWLVIITDENVHNLMLDFAQPHYGTSFYVCLLDAKAMCCLISFYW